jgi:formamidopyrimidine-DNA glycosylase
MPELPEVEVLTRYLRPLLDGRTIRGVTIYRDKSIRPDDPAKLSSALKGARFEALNRRGKYLVFSLRKGNMRFDLLGHLGMTGRMYLADPRATLPKHAAVVFDLDQGRFIFEDTRYFGRISLDLSALGDLGPEPLSADFTANYFHAALRPSGQAIKVRLLDQSLVAGVGNIYASEALYRARIVPTRPARRLTRQQTSRLRECIREVLAEAIEFGSTVPLSWNAPGNGLFYYGRTLEAPDYYEEKLAVYDRENQPCLECGAKIRRIVQAGRSTFCCPACQHS